MLLRLPVELLNLVARQLKPSDLKRLRQVCRTLSFLTSPLVFRRLVLDIDSDRLGLILALLDDIASGKSNVGIYIQCLEINSFNPPPYKSLQLWRRITKKHALACRMVEDQFISAIPQFVSVKSLSLNISNMQFTEATSEDTIMRLLSALPKLSHLFLSVPNDIDVKIPESLSRYFNNLSGLHFSGGTSLHCDTLKSIVAHSPNLITLSIDGSPLSVDGDRFVSIAKLVSAVPVGVSLPLQTLTLGTISFDSSIDCHLQSLTTLNITPDFLDVPPHFWNTLQSSRVKLQNLTVHQGDAPLLEYLQSYSGLVSLSFDLCGFRHNDRRDSDAMADVMYRGVLPMHTESLKVLHIRTPYEGKWTLGRSQLDGILTCRCLTSLVIGVGLSEVEAPEEVNAINRLLNAIDHNILPNIRVARLFLAYPTSARAMGDSVLLMHSAHGVRGGALLNALVKKYTCAWPSSALVDLKLSTGHLHVGHASLNTYKLGRHRADRQWRFSLQIQTSSKNVY